MPPDVSNIHSPIAMLISQINRNTLPRGLADKMPGWHSIATTWEHDKKVSFDPMYAAGDYVFVVKPPLPTLTSKQLAAEGYSTLMPKRHGLYRVLSFRPENLKILQ